MDKDERVYRAFMLTREELNNVESFIKVLRKEDPEAWREEYRKKQAAGVRYEYRENGASAIGVGGRYLTFNGKKEGYREVVETPKPPLPHLESRKLWLAQREAGTNEVWQDIGANGEIFDFHRDKEPRWSPFRIYRVKPKTEKRYMAMVKGIDGTVISTSSIRTETEEQFRSRVNNNGWVIVGDIVEREVEIGND